MRSDRYIFHDNEPRTAGRKGGDNPEDHLTKHTDSKMWGGNGKGENTRKNTEEGEWVVMQIPNSGRRRRTNHYRRRWLKNMR